MRAATSTFMGCKRKRASTIVYRMLNSLVCAKSRLTIENLHSTHSSSRERRPCAVNGHGQSKHVILYYTIHTFMSASYIRKHNRTHVVHACVLLMRPVSNPTNTHTKPIHNIRQRLPNATVPQTISSCIPEYTI